MSKQKLSPTQIEEMYDSGEMRLSQERNDFLLPQIFEFVKSQKWINIRPEYQRRLVWDQKKKSRFIESLLMNIPIPPVFLYEYDLSRYEVMDGQQRLNAILEFYENRLKLTGLTTWSPLNGKVYGECPPRIQRGLDRRRISATVLIAENAKDRRQGDKVRQVVFERLNTGGITLNAQELRNCVFSGSFNDLILELVKGQLFCEILGIPSYEDNYRPCEGFISEEMAKNSFFKRMKDCQIALRFFAFRDESKVKGSVKTILDRCMSQYRNADDSTILQLKDAFNNSLNLSHSIFGEDTFKIKRVRDGKSKHELSIPLFDAVMVSCERLMPYSAALIGSREKIAVRFDEAFQDKTKREILTGKGNTAEHVKARVRLVCEMMSKEVG